MILFICYLILGALAGFLAGLFGIGGGLIIVPVLANIELILNNNPDPMQYATATSLAVMIFTALGSTYSHNIKGAVDFRIVRFIGPTSAISAMFSRYIANQIPSDKLAIFFIISLYLIALSMLIQRDFSKQSSLDYSINEIALILVGSVVGFIAAMLGIGGGIFIVPFLIRLGVPVTRAIGTAAACGLIVAINGTISSVIFSSVTGIPYAFGYVIIPAFIAISFSGGFFVMLGVKVAHTIHDERLKKSFGILLLLVASFSLKNIIIMS